MVELTPSFLLEFEALDRDHQQLADIVNLIVQAIDDDEAEKCKPLAASFVKSTKLHFANEEALLVKAGYPNVKKHQDHHKSLYSKMDHILEFAKMAGENQLARDSLRKELVFFLMDDIITSDMEFKAFIEEKA
ncbi:MAG: hemerythrin family protein [Alphaproteobacteria bacterium]|mgnify:FL=1|jgi:hemerythrin-like metal-binding protein|nr:hemerythrin family protein [Alphaproteobacteria bacterium]MBT7943368.1 hemerythrin family protein [Alphaproteobacteria bacterium]